MTDEAFAPHPRLTPGTILGRPPGYNPGGNCGGHHLPHNLRRWLILTAGRRLDCDRARTVPWLCCPAYDTASFAGGTAGAAAAGRNPSKRPPDAVLRARFSLEFARGIG
mgnify:CR=1 FL=1